MKKNKKQKFISLIFLSLFVLFCQTIVYSAINATMSIRGDAYARVETDVRITGFRLGTTLNASSNYEEFGKNHIVTEIDLLDSSSYITYYVEITNYGSVDVGIFDITGLPSGVNYSIKDYNLHDKICDDTGKCNSFIKKTYEITLSTNSTYMGQVQLNFDFRTYHTVTYTDIENKGYPTEVIDGGNFKVTFQEELKRVQVMYNNREILYYKKVLNGQTITLSNITNDIEVKTKEQVAKLVSGELNEVGSEVCIGEECFYIISNNGEIVTMLSKYNLYVGGVYDTSSSTWTAYGTEATGIQNKNMIGWINKSTNSYYGTTAFSKTNSTYKGSIVEGYVNNYKNILETKYNAEIINARLITYEEVTNENTFGCVDDSTCNNTYPWIYTTSYWIETAYDSKNIWNVNSFGQFNYNLYNKTLESGVRPVIEISIDEIKPLIRIESGDLDTVGSELCIKDECFYVISSNENNVAMLAKYNLYVGNECTSASASSCTKYDAATGIQDASMIGYKLGEPIRKGTSNFANTNYWGTTASTYPSNVYNENSSLYSYVENYKNYLTTIGATPTVARIITYDELINLGCNGQDENCRSAPEWVYATSYWTDTAATSTNLWALNTYGNFYHLDYQYTGTFGCRPVIEIPKWLFADTIEVIINNKTYSAKEGMTWREWSQSKYNVLNLYESGNVLRNSSLTYLGYMIDNKCYTHDLDSAIDNTKNYTLSCGSGSDD